MKAIKKFGIVTAVLLSISSLSSNANELVVKLSDGFVNVKEYIELLGGESETKEFVINKIDDTKIKKYIFKIKEEIKNQYNILEIFENGQGIYINGQYIPFASEEVNGFVVPKVKKAITNNQQVKIPKEILEVYFGTQVIDDEKMQINKEININKGILGEFNELIENNYKNTQLEDEKNEKDLEKKKEEKPKLEKPNKLNPKPENTKPNKPSPKPEEENINPNRPNLKPEEEKPKPESPKPEEEKPKPEEESPKPEPESPQIDEDSTIPEEEKPKPEEENLKPQEINPELED